MNINLTSSEFSKRIESEIYGSKEDSMIETVAFDTRKILNPNNCAFFALNGEFRDGHQFIKDAYKQGVRIFVCSKKIDFDTFPEAQFHHVPSSLKALQRLAKFHRNQYKIPLIGITGSVGKTTVKEWIYHLLSDKFSVHRSPKSYNSKLGVALSLLELNESHQLALIEAGISQANEMHVLQEMIQATIGIFTAFGSAHSQNFANREEHLVEKLKLFTSCKTVFISDEIYLSYSDLKELKDKKFKSISASNFQTLLKFSPFQDKASLNNLSLAIAIAKEFSLDEKEIIQKIKTLPRLALRMETFDGIQGNVVINDAYNADLDALNQSLEYQMSIANGKVRTAIIGVDGLNEQQIQKIKHKLKSYNLYQCYFVSGNEIPPIETIRQQVILIKGTRASQIQRIARLFQLKKHKTRIEINLSAVKHNLDYFRSLLHKECKILVMVKASSYGSGAEKMAEFLEKNGVEYLGVAYADEGIELRKHGVKIPILVMNADEDSFDDIIQYKLEPALYSFSILDSFIKALINLGLENYPVHLKIDTGMKRLGFHSLDLHKLIDVLLAQPEIKVQSIYSHLAETDNLKEKEFTNKQIKEFTEFCASIQKRLHYPFMKHILNSEGIQRFPEAQFDMVRLGIGLYGISVNKEVAKHTQKVISWKSIVSQINTIKPGESVGYSRSFIADKEMRIATIPVGYADGFSRILSQGKGGVYIQNKYCKVLGNVCMDMIMVDVSLTTCQEGDVVEIIGEQQSIEQLAIDMQTIPYEVLTSLSKRLQRVYLEE